MACGNLQQSQPAAAMPDLCQLHNRTRQQLLVPRLYPARTFLTRLRGLMYRPPPDPDEALWLVPCRAVHTMGMRFSLDILFLDRQLQVIATRWSVSPGLRGISARGAHSTVEATAGVLVGRVEPGEYLEIRP